MGALAPCHQPRGRTVSAPNAVRLPAAQARDNRHRARMRQRSPFDIGQNFLPGPTIVQAIENSEAPEWRPLWILQSEMVAKTKEQV